MSLEILPNEFMGLLQRHKSISSHIFDLMVRFDICELIPPLNLGCKLGGSFCRTGLGRLHALLFPQMVLKRDQDALILGIQSDLKVEHRS